MEQGDVKASTGIDHNGFAGVAYPYPPPKMSFLRKQESRNH